MNIHYVKNKKNDKNPTTTSSENQRLQSSYRSYHYYYYCYLLLGTFCALNHDNDQGHGYHNSVMDEGHVLEDMPQ